MQRIKLIWATLAAMLLVVPAVSGGVAVFVPTYGSDTQTMASIGLRFDFGDMQPEIVGQVRHTRTDTDNDVTGALGEIAFPLMGEKQFIPTVRGMGLIGTPDVQGMAGVGFDFASQQPLLGLGVQGPFVEGGLDIQLDGALHPYLGFNSYDGAPDRVVIPAPPLVN